MAGDQVSASVQYYYQSGETGTNPDIVTPLLSSLAVAIGGNATVGTLTHGSAPGITSNLNSTPGFVTAIEPNNNTTGTPQAYLTILFFDERFNFIAAADGGVAQQQVASSWTTSTPALALANIKAPKNGYAYAYISNRSDQSVYFDNLVVGVVAGNIIEEDHYYSFGLKIAAISSRKLGDAGEGKLSNPYLYNDKEMLDEDAGLNWYDYGFRNYDPQIGRFMQLDPLTDDYPFLTPYQYASNDPVTNVDVDGLEGQIVTWAQGVQSGEDVFHNSLESVTVTFRPVAAAAKSAKGLSSAARIAQIVARGAADALANANSLGLYDIFGGNHLSSYGEPQEQAAYLRGRVAGDVAAGAQATNEIEAGGGVALTTGVETVGFGAIVGGAIALHGAGAGAVAVVDAAKSLKILYQLNITAKDGSGGGNHNENSNKDLSNSRDGTVKAKDLKIGHSEKTITKSADYQKIKKLSNKELIKSVLKPKKYDPVTINTKTGNVVDGNTRIYEIQRRGLDVDVPVERYTPSDSHLFDDQQKD